jgi:hypothetical protein
MDIDNATRKSLNQKGRNQRKEACQHDEIDRKLLKKGHHELLIVQICFHGDSSRNT